MDKNEFKERWLPHADDFYLAAFRILKSVPDAKDAVQDLYIRLWCSRDRLDNIRDCTAYGMTVLKNICIDRLRKLHKDRVPDLNSDNSGEMQTDETAEKVIVAKERIRELEAGIARLPDNQRKVFVMRFYRQMPYDEIAAATGFSGINVRVMINRARAFLKKSVRLY